MAKTLENTIHLEIGIGIHLHSLNPTGSHILLDDIRSFWMQVPVQSARTNKTQ